MSVLKRLLVGVVIPVLLLGIGVGVVALMFLFKPTAENSDVAAPAFPVEVIVAHGATMPAIIVGAGLVEAEQQVALAPEVAGRIVRLAEGLRPGREFKKGEMILQLDRRDLEAALAAEIARLKSAELEFALEEQRQGTVRRELELVGGQEENELALRKPHFALAKANLEAAQEAVARAKLNVRRATLVSPFNALVASETADVGQLVNSASPVVTLVGTDAARVSISVATDQLSHLSIPGISEGEGSRGRVYQKDEEGGVAGRPAVVTGVAGSLDPQTRTATVVLSVPNPFSEGDVPLFPGSYVSVELEGAPVEGVMAVPHMALFQGETIWVEEEGVLKSKAVRVGWRSPEKTYIVDGLADGDRVVVTPMSMPMNGMSVAAAESSSTQAGE
jgi:RND family efflux transporter MFP subunit